MQLKTNKFGSDVLFNADDLDENNKLFIASTACLTLQTETEKWACTLFNVTCQLPEQADIIVLLSCQVTELAILNDIRTIERYMIDYPDKEYFIGGCLAQRFDIALPEGVKRLEHLRNNDQIINKYNTVFWEKPFWVKNFNPVDKKCDGSLFRYDKPVMLGGGCHGKCKYCSIKVTRDNPYSIDKHVIFDEMVNANKSIVFVADTITVEQIIDTAAMAIKLNKQVSYRNVEPTNLIKAKKVFINLATRGLLKTIHCPVQSDLPVVLKDMNRDIDTTLEAIQFCKDLKDLGVYTATNVIINYTAEFNENINIIFNRLTDFFDHIAWNPYWDGNWDRKHAEKSFKHYFKE